MTDRCGTKDPRFHDRVWMRNRYQEHGDMWIALELGCSRKTVREQRSTMGIASRPAHRPRGATRLRSVTDLDATIALIRQRSVDEADCNVTRDLLAARVRAFAVAQDPDEIDDLLIQIAATVTVMHHLRQQRTAQAA